jgi:hypothetical protein
MDHWLVQAVLTVCALLAFLMYCKAVRRASDIEAKNSSGETRRSAKQMTALKSLDEAAQALDRWIDKQAGNEATPIRIQMAAFAAALPFALLFHTTYYPMLVALYALAIVAAIVLGFWLRPLRDVFLVRTTLLFSSPIPSRSAKHDQVALRVEVTRLWLLFFPTFASLAFLIVASVNGLIWWDSIAYPLVFLAQIIVFNILSTWVTERSVLRDATAAFVEHLFGKRNWLGYSFKDDAGGYHGGTGLRLARIASGEIGGIVLYKAINPDSNKIASAFLFHRFKIIGRGLPEFDEATTSAHSVQAQVVPEIL